MKTKAIKYKQRAINVWNEVSPFYHNRWAKNEIGPFSVTNDLIKSARIKSGHTVLDLACGTGLVTKKILTKVGNGQVYGVDSSKSALDIARKWVGNKKNIHFILGDAETIQFDKRFDIITCQYALFFFPNAQKVLKNMKKFLKKNGVIVMSVHGKHNVPYFDSILKPARNLIPDYLPKYPDMDRFGTKSTFKDVFVKAGYNRIVVKKLLFRYSPGTVSDYWNNYKKYLSKPLKEKFNMLSKFQKANFREMVKDNTLQYTKKNGEIDFPWEVLLLVARN